MRSFVLWEDLPASWPNKKKVAWARYLNGNERSLRDYDSRMYWQRDNEKRKASKARRNAA